MHKRLIIWGYGLLMSLLIGSGLGGFYLLQGALIELIGIGHVVRPVFNALWIFLIGVLIFWIQRRFTQLPKPLGQIRADLKATGTSDYRFLPLQFLLPALILTSGTSLGPEATLVSTTCLGGIWLLDKLRYLEVNWNHLSTSARLHAMLEVNHKLLSRSKTQRLNSLWTPLTLCFFAAGVLSFYLTCKFGGEPSVIVYLGRSAWQWRELLWLVPIFIGGRLLGRLELSLMIALRKILLGRIHRDWSLLLIGGIAIYAASIWLPAINCSGMANFHLLAGSWQHHSTGALLLASGLKLGLLTICLNTGWIGGDIFPVLFCTTAQAIALSFWLPLDPMFVIAVFAIAAGGTILESPLVAGGVMGIMFLPPNLLPICVVVIALLMLCDHFTQPHWVRFSDAVHHMLTA
ncbi:chloride channel protein [Lacticaseibacillus porcinae]|uniref:chloride channel protein n=1 Tax=Lacticaseibacillus porcinae TaxID=1123687 RepID=UPI000F768DAD|nr:chloride channel protein [Lacticaseibacillus porcinae]